MRTREIRKFRRLIRKTGRQAGLLAGRRDQHADVTVAHGHVLLELADLGSTSLKDLADALGLDKSTASKAVEALVSRGLVKRAQDPEDRRRVLISLSAKGSRKVVEIDSYGDEIASGVLREVPRAKRPDVIEHLGLLVEAYERFEQTNPERKRKP